jgi:prevent-host-death family protein
MSNPNLSIDLQYGVVPVSRAASALATLIKRSNAMGKPIIITQKGYPTGVLLSIELYTALRDLAMNGGDSVIELPVAQQVEEEASSRGRRMRKVDPEAITDAITDAIIEEEPEPPAKRRGRKKATE